MTEMIERIAKAHYEKYFENLIGCCEPHWNELTVDHKLRLMESAKAGIEAMKEPTENMLMHVPYQSHEPPIFTYKRIIEAALKND